MIFIFNDRFELKTPLFNFDSFYQIKDSAFLKSSYIEDKTIEVSTNVRDRHFFKVTSSESDITGTIRIEYYVADEYLDTHSAILNKTFGCNESWYDKNSSHFYENYDTLIKNDGNHFTIRYKDYSIIYPYSGFYGEKYTLCKIINYVKVFIGIIIIVVSIKKFDKL